MMVDISIVNNFMPVSVAMTYIEGHKAKKKKQNFCSQFVAKFSVHQYVFGMLLKLLCLLKLIVV